MVPLGEEIPLEWGHQRGVHPLRNGYFTAISSFIMRHRLAAYHNKHCWWAFRRYQHRWPWTTLNPKIRCLVIFVAISGCDTFLKSEFSLKYTGDGPRQPAYAGAVARLMSISSDFLFVATAAGEWWYVYSVFWFRFLPKQIWSLLPLFRYLLPIE